MFAGVIHGVPQNRVKNAVRRIKTGQLPSAPYGFLELVFRKCRFHMRQENPAGMDILQQGILQAVRLALHAINNHAWQILRVSRHPAWRKQVFATSHGAGKNRAPLAIKRLEFETETKPGGGLHGIEER